MGFSTDTLSRIGVSGQIEGGKFVPFSFTWEGSSKATAFTYDTWIIASRMYNIPPFDRIKTGMMFKFGPFLLQVVSEDASEGLIFCERIDKGIA